MRATTGLLRFVFSLLLLLLFLPTSGAAQQNVEIKGKVVDPDSLGVPGATVTVTNEGTGLVRTVVTGAGGTYVITPLPPGTYKVSVEMDSFANIQRTGLELASGSQTTLDWQLKVAAVEETLTVTGQAPLVERTNNTLGATLSPREMEEVPSNFRNFLALTALVPGITPSPSTSTFEGGGVTANGSPSNANVYLIDGTYNNDDRLGSNSPQVRVVLDSVAEYQVLGNQYSVEYGGGVGAIMNTVTRSGTNTFAGRMYGYFRDDAFNSRSPLLASDVDKPNETTQQIGFALGGPIVRNHAHFQMSLEHDNEIQGGLKTMPAVAAPLARDFLAEFEVKAYNFFGRGDVQVTDNMFINARYVLEVAPTSGDGHLTDLTLPDARRLESDYDASFGASITNVLGDRASNVLRTGVIREKLAGSNTTAEYYKDKTTYFNWFRGFDGRDQFDIGPQNAHPSYIAGRGGAGAFTIIKTYTIDDTFNYHLSTGRGDHTFKFGGGYSSNNADPRATVDSGSFLFTSDRPFDPAIPATYPTQFSSQLGPSGSNTFDVSSHDYRYNFFGEDQWRFNGHLTFNMGLRYDYQDQTPDSKDDFAPRFGAVYDLSGDGKTVIRAGVGRFSTTVPISLTLNLLQSGLITKFPTVTITDLNSPVLKPDMITDTAGNPGVAVLSAAGKSALRAERDRVLAGLTFTRDPLIPGEDLQMMYQIGWSAGVAHALTNQMAMTVDYVANVAHDLMGRVDINEPVNGVRPGIGVIDPDAELIPPVARNTAFRRILQYQTRSEFNNDYKSMQFSFVKRFANRWSMRNAYTLQHGTYVGLGNSDGRRVWLDNDIRADYGRSGSDRKHVLAVSGTVNPWRQLTVAVSATAVSGSVVNETLGRDANNDTDATNDRPVAGVDDKVTPILSPLDSQGRAVINGLEGPGRFDMALSFRYAIGLGGAKSVDLSWDIFNLTNRVNYDAPSGNRASASFMVPSTAGAPRQMQFGVRFRF